MNRRIPNGTYGGVRGKLSWKKNMRADLLDFFHDGRKCQFKNTKKDFM